MKRKLSFLLSFLTIVLFANAQTTITGKVTDDGGRAISGISILVKGTAKGTSTTSDGSFSIEAASNATLVLSGIGFNSKEIKVDGRNSIAATLSLNQSDLNAVVVTALGVKRSEKSLVYANQVVKGSEINTVKTDNLMNTLNGKIAGVNISPSSSGVGGSVKVVLRGNKNAFGTNQPLYVVDGMPITNSANANGQPNGTFGGGPDGGDGISNMNPDDIESVTILEGAAAAALYGSQAANGVVLITTKKGKVGKAEINLSSSYTNNSISYKPEFQNKYGVTPNGNQSWGPALSTPYTDNRLSDFYIHGQNFTNSINFSAGSEIAQTYFSYAHTSANGVQPTNDLGRNNFTFREIGHFLNNKLTVDVNTNYIDQKINNTPGQGLYFNPLTGLYLFPVGTDITSYKNQYGTPQPARNGLLTQNWIANEDVQQNPWWILNKNPNYSTRNRFLINATVKYDFSTNLSVQVRGNTDRVSDNWERDLFAGTNPVLVTGNNGSFTGSSQVFTQRYGDIIANFKVPLKAAFKIDGLVGSSITDGNTVGQSFGAGSGLVIPNVFILQNVVTTSTSPVSTLPAYNNQVQSVFGNLNLSYNNWAYLALTGRNDWSSNLAYTNNQSYFYPSIGLSLIMSEVLKFPEFITFAKLRGSYAEVATSVPQYITNPLNSLAGGGSVNFNNVEPNPQLRPTNTKSSEAGFDIRLFENRLNVNFTWYKSNTLNQFIQYTPAASTGYSVGYLNAGNIQNTGTTLLISYDVLRGKNFTWNTALNYSNNKNTILELNPSAPTATIFLTGYSPNAYGSGLTKGGSWADIYGVMFQRNATGQIMLNSSDQPINNNKFVKVGNPNPNWQMGWNNSFTYRKFNLSMLVDGKFGGQVLSMTQMMMDSYGTSKVTGQARDNGGVTINGVDPTGKAVTSVDAKLWYSTIGGRSGIAEPYVYSATVVRMRQIALGYDFTVGKSAIKNLRLSLIGSNLFYISKKAPYDPEITMSTGNGLSGVDVFNQPTTRNIGAQLNITF